MSAEERNRRGPKIVVGTTPTPKGRGPTARLDAVPRTASKKDAHETIPGLPLTKLRTSFEPQEFARVIRQQGYYVAWRKAALCPCLNANTEQPDINCAFCDGSGFYYFDPMQIRSIMSRFTRDAKVYEKFGTWVEGTAQCTVEAQYRLGYADQIEMMDSVMPFSEIITKNNRRGRRAQLPANTDCARYRIVQVTAALWINEDDQMETLVEGTHFKLTDDGWIEWLAKGAEIEDGSPISLVYTFHPIFIVMSHNNALRDVNRQKKVPMPIVTSLPIQATVKLDYLMEIKRPLAALQQRINKTLDDQVPNRGEEDA